MTKASDLFIQCLEEEGVEYIFGVPGEENLDMLDSLSRSKQIKLILTRHEQGAGFMAATYGRHTGKTGVCLATLGPGATNLVTAAAYAQLGGMPILMVTGQKPIKKSKQGRFQILDVVAMMEPITKYTHQLASADNIPSRIREAFRLAEEEKPGATHLEFPEDVADEQTDSHADQAQHRAPADRRSEGGARRGREDREGASRRCWCIGAGANRKLTGRMLLQFVEKTGIPFVTTQLGKGVIDETNPKFLGCAALSANDFVHKAIEAADLIVNVGHDVIEKPPFFMKNGGTEVIHVSTRSAEVDPVYFPQIEVIGDIANAIWQMKEDIVPSGRWNFDKMMTARAGRGRAQRQARRGLPLPGLPVLPGQGGARGDAGRRHHLPRQRRLQDLVRAQLSGARSRTRCCSTMRWRRWAPACRRRWPRRWSIPTAR